MAIHLGSAALTVSATLTATASFETARITEAFIEVVEADPGAARVTESFVELVEAAPGAARVTESFVELVAGINHHFAAAPFSGAAAIQGVEADHVSTDTFTEASDTDLTAHTDDWGNSWSLTGYDNMHISGNALVKK